VQLSAVFVGLCVGYFYFLKPWEIFKNNFVYVGKASSFAIFGLWVGLRELQMCLLLGFLYLNLLAFCKYPLCIWFCIIKIIFFYLILPGISNNLTFITNYHIF